MKRRRSVLSVLALGLSLTGCAICQSPFDYCNAVVGPGGPNCDWGARRGSALAPMGEGPAEPQLGPTPAEPPSDDSADESDTSPAETTATYDAVDTLVR